MNMNNRFLDSLYRETVDVKSYASLLNVLKGVACVNDKTKVAYHKLYHITVGNPNANIFIQVDMVNNHIDFTARKFNGENYDILGNHTIYQTKHGLKDFLNYFEPQYS